MTASRFSAVVVVGAALALCGGCVSSPKDFAPLVRELSRDPATARIAVHATSFSLEIERANPGTNTQPHSVSNGTITVGK